MIHLRRREYGGNPLLRLDHRSGEPIWKQIVEQIKYRVACEQLKPGDKLPSIRSLANDLGINPRTVVKAYEELRYAGLTVMRQGQGVFITSNEDTVPAKMRRKSIGEMAQRLISESVRLGADAEEILEVMKSELEKLDK